MESSQEVHQLTENRHATVVQYDLTSSEDELDEDHSYIYCSATNLSPMPPQNSDEENEESAVNLPSSQDRETSLRSPQQRAAWETKSSPFPGRAKAWRHHTTQEALRSTNARPTVRALAIPERSQVVLNPCPLAGGTWPTSGSQHLYESVRTCSF